VNERYEEGLAIRREVLGSEYVDAALASADELGRPLQELVTEYCWGALWGRPGLPRRTRSLLNVGMLAALNRPHELQLHTRGALRNGCSEAEIIEVVLQVAVYCGVPAAVDAMRNIRAAIAAHEEAGSASGSS
jgi:4-carboxymuconolactone decarboxylase